MSRLVAIVLLNLIGTLPALDAVSCPDGCTDVAHAHASLEPGVAAAGACGFCLNAVGLHRDSPTVIGIARLAGLSVVPVPRLLSLAPPSIDRPPRAS